MSRPRKAPPAPAIPADLTDAQRALIAGSSSDSARAILLSLYAKARAAKR